MLFSPVGAPGQTDIEEVDQVWNDDVELQFGTDGDVQIRWDTGQTQDALLFGLSGSNNIIFCEVADMATDFGRGNSTNPTIYIQSADAAVVTDYIRLYHNQDDGIADVGSGDWRLQAGGVTFYQGDTTAQIFTQAVATSGSPVFITATGGAHTTLAASTEASSVLYDLSATVQFATGALATQRAFRISAPTYRFVGASTLTDAATLYVSGAPVAGTNATITNAYALWVDSGLSKFDGAVTLDGALTSTAGNISLTQAVAASGSPVFITATSGAHTTLTASAESSSVLYDLSATVQFATGALATQRAFRISAPTYGFVGASTLTDAATFYVSGAPIAGTNATITNSRSIWVGAGMSELNRNALGAAATDATIGLLLANTTDAAAGAQQWSPLFVWEGQGWRTDSTAATREVQMAMQMRPVQGAANPTGALHFLTNINDAGFTSVMNVNSAGDLTVSGTGAFTGAVTLSSGATVSSVGINLLTDIGLVLGSGGTTILRWGSGFTVDALVWGFDETGRHFHFCDYGDVGFDWANSASANPTLFIHSATASTTQFLSLAHNQTNVAYGAGFGGHTFTQGIATTGSPIVFSVTGAAHTTLTASVEAATVIYDLSATVQFATGALATQRAFQITAPTYGFVGASTITSAATLYISGAPIAGTNATITTSYALWVDAGISRFDGAIRLGNAYAAGITVGTGTVQVQDSTGTTYNLICVAA